MHSEPRRCIDAVTFGEHATPARIRNLERSIRLTLFDQRVDVVLIELNQLGQEGKLVVHLQQVGASLFDGSERGLEVPGGQRRLSFEDRELRQTCVRRPLDSRHAVRRCQGALVQQLPATAVAPGHRDVCPIDVRLLPDRADLGRHRAAPLVEPLGLVPFCEARMRGPQIHRPIRRVAFEAGAVGHLERFVEIRERLARVSTQHVRVAKAAERFLQRFRRTPGFLRRDGAQLCGQGQVELAEARVADARIRQDQRVCRGLLQRLKLQRPLEKYQPLVVAATQQPAHAKVVQAQQLSMSIAAYRGAVEGAIQRGIGWIPLPLQQPGLTFEEVRVNLKIRIVGRQPASFCRDLDHAGQIVRDRRDSGIEVAAARADGGEPGEVRDGFPELRFGVRKVAPHDQDFGTKQAEPPSQLRVVFVADSAERIAGLPERAGCVAEAKRFLCLVEGGTEIGRRPSRASRREQRHRDGKPLHGTTGHRFKSRRCRCPKRRRRRNRRRWAIRS